MDTSLTNKTVLIVEDDDALLQPLRQMVRDFGVHAILIAGTGEDGISVLGESPVDLVISDYHLPTSSGLEFARRLRRGEGGANPATPIIMLAADDERAKVEDANDIGINGFIGKPVSPSSLYSSMLAVTSKGAKFISTENYIGPDRRENPRAVMVDWETVKDAMSASLKATETPFIRSAHNDIKAIIRALEDAVSNPAGQKQAIRSIASLAGFIMENGKQANYPLMNSIAESLINFCRGEQDLGVDQVEVIKSHITAMAALISDKIDGDDHVIGSTILDLLRNSSRQKIVSPQAIVWPRTNT